MANTRKFNVKGTKLVQYWGNDGKVIIPEGITHIGDSAFAYSQKLTEVVIPLSVEEVGTSTFYGCTGLKSVTLSRKTKIGEFAFYNCHSEITLKYYED